MPKLRIIYSSTSGHTEYVVDALAEHLGRSADIDVVVKHVEESRSADMLDCDVLLLASGTWNQGLLPADFGKFIEEAEGIDLDGKPTCVIGLGDDRYYYTCRATARLMRFTRDIGGKNLLPPLPIVNEPYGQEDKVEEWGDKLLSALS